MTSSFLKTNSSNLVEAALTGAISQGVDKFMYNQPIDVKKFGLSAVSSFSAETVGAYVLPHLPVSVTYSRTALNPVISGLLYAGGDKVLHLDNRSFLFCFLLQVGSEIAGSYAATPLKKTLGLAY